MTYRSVKVTARRWEQGWELIIDSDHATQVRTLDRAVQQVRDYLDTDDPDVDHSGWVVIVVPEIDGLDEVRAAREVTRRAAEMSEQAAARSRAVATNLRAQGLSVTDTAEIMGVSRGRVSQLTAGRRPRN